MTEGQHDDCANDLEDLVWSQSQDAKATVDFVIKAIDKLKRERNPCSRWRAFITPSKC